MKYLIRSIALSLYALLLGCVQTTPPSPTTSVMYSTPYVSQTNPTATATQMLKPVGPAIRGAAASGGFRGR